MWQRIDRKGVERFLKFSVIGGTTFSLDLLLLFLFIDVLGWNYLFATGFAFLLAMTVNFALNFLFVFRGTERALHQAYIRFMLVALAAFVLVLACMYVLVGLLEQNYLLSRIAVASLVGFLHYLLNLYKVFSVAGVHLPSFEK